MPFQVIPREQSFFDLFEATAALIDDGARKLKTLTEHFAEHEIYAAQVKKLELEADEITHRVMATLSTTFVTPFDREDIFRLASQLDDVLDSMEAVAELLVLHQIEEPLPELRQQADVLVRITGEMVQAVRGLRSLQGQDRHLVEINRLENEGDRITREAVASLFDGGIDPMVVIRWKDVFERLEAAIDATEHVANILEGIIIKNS